VTARRRAAAPTGRRPPAAREDGALVGLLCHEVGNLLAGLRLSGHLLAELSDADERRHVAGDVERLAAQAGALVAQLRVLQRGDEPQRARVAASDLLAAVAHDVAGALLGRVRLDVARGRGLPALRVEPDLAHRVLVGIVLAAVEAASPSGRVRVTARGEGRRVCIRVADDGRRPEDPATGRAARRGRPLHVRVADAVLRRSGGRATLATTRSGTRVELWLPAAGGAAGRGRA
jgi:signal transduction histidine kinase